MPHVYSTNVQYLAIKLSASSGSATLMPCLVGGCKSREMENGGKMEKWGNRKIIAFPRVCLIGRMEKSGEMEISYVWLRRK